MTSPNSALLHGAKGPRCVGAGLRPHDFSNAKPSVWAGDRDRDGASGLRRAPPALALCGPDLAGSWFIMPNPIQAGAYVSRLLMDAPGARSTALKLVRRLARHGPSLRNREGLSPREHDITLRRITCWRPGWLCREADKGDFIGPPDAPGACRRKKAGWPNECWNSRWKIRALRLCSTMSGIVRDGSAGEHGARRAATMPCRLGAAASHWVTCHAHRFKRSKELLAKHLPKIEMNGQKTLCGQSQPSRRFTIPKSTRMKADIGT